jgi:hypothetical protein
MPQTDGGGSRIWKLTHVMYTMLSSVTHNNISLKRKVSKLQYLAPLILTESWLQVAAGSPLELAFCSSGSALVSLSLRLFSLSLKMNKLTFCGAASLLDALRRS